LNGFSYRTKKNGATKIDEHPQSFPASKLDSTGTGISHFHFLTHAYKDKMDDLQALAYFLSLTHISRKVALQEKSLIKYLGNKWTEYSPEQKEELLNDLCVPHFIRDEQPSSAADKDDDDLPNCWPTLKLACGEKIIVDETDVRKTFS
jgi:hypothetical protein